MILCIQGSSQQHYSDVQFDKILKNDLNYKYLKEKNNNQDIPYCMWDNITPEPSQNEKLLKCLENRKQITLTEMEYIIDFVQNNIDNKPIPPKPNPQPCTQPKSSCQIL